MKTHINLNLEEFIGLVVVGVLLVIGIAIVMKFITPVLVTVGLLAAPFTLTETLFFLILLTLIVRKI